MALGGGFKIARTWVGYRRDGRETILCLLVSRARGFAAAAQGLCQALRFQPQAAAPAAQGNAFAAQADDASAIHYNPAGLTQVPGVQALFGTTLLGGSIKATTATGVDTRGDFGGSIAFPPPSHTYISANLGALGLKGWSSVTVGLG